MRCFEFLVVVALISGGRAEDLRSEGEDAPDVGVHPHDEGLRRKDQEIETGDRTITKGECKCYKACTNTHTHYHTCKDSKRKKTDCSCGGCVCCDGEYNKKGTKCCSRLNSKGTKCCTKGDCCEEWTKGGKKCLNTHNGVETICTCEERCECMRACTKTKTSKCKTKDLRSECPCDKQCECDKCKNDKCTKYTKTWCECEDEGHVSILGWGQLAPSVLWGRPDDDTEITSGVCGKGRCYTKDPWSSYQVSWDTPCGDIGQSPCPATMWNMSSMNSFGNEYKCGKCYQLHWRNEFFWNQDYIRDDWFNQVDLMSNKDEPFYYHDYVTGACPDANCHDRRVDMIVKIVDIHTTEEIMQRVNHRVEYGLSKYTNVDIGLGQNGWEKICPYLCESEQCVGLNQADHCFADSFYRFLDTNETVHGHYCGTQTVQQSVFSLPRMFHWVEVDCSTGNWYDLSAAGYHGIGLTAFCAVLLLIGLL